jgi:hypothetical protein
VLLFPSALSKELLLPLSKFATVFVGKNIYCVVFYSAQGAEADSTFDVRVLSFMKQTKRFDLTFFIFKI